MRFKLTLVAIAGLLVITSCTKIYNPRLINDTQLTYDGDNGEAYFSFDGTKLIFQSKRNGNECDKIYTMNVDGTDMKQVSTNEGAHTCSYWSKDDDFILYSSTKHDGADCPSVFKPKDPTKYVWPLRNFDIYKANPDGSDIVRLTNNNSYDAEATVHPTENMIIYTAWQNGDIDLYEMDYDGKNIKRITTEYGYDGAAYYSPNGTKIVWRAWYPQTTADTLQWQANMKGKYIEAVPLDIYVADRDASNKVRLTNNGATNWAPSWHPDGKRIVFSSNMDDWNEEYDSFGHNFELYIINVDGTNLTRLTNNNTFDSFPMFSPDGQKLVYGTNRGSDNPRQTNVYISDYIE